MARRIIPWLGLFAIYAAVPTVGAGDYGRGVRDRLAEAISGHAGAELLVAALAALAFALGAVLARRITPEPWATLCVLAFALSPPALAYASRPHADLVAAALVTGALLLALRAREDPRRADVLLAAALLAALPWLGTSYVLAGVPALAALVHWTLRHGRRVLGLLAVEIVAASVVVLLSVPNSSDLRSALDHAGEGYRLAPWTPVLVLTAAGGWLLWRSWRDLLAQALPGRRDVEVAATLALATCVGALLHPAAALPCAAAVGAWGFQRARRVALVLAALGIGAAAWLVIFASN